MLLAGWLPRRGEWVVAVAGLLLLSATFTLPRPPAMVQAARLAEKSCPALVTQWGVRLLRETTALPVTDGWYKGDAALALSQGACRLSRLPIAASEMPTAVRQHWFARALPPNPDSGSPYRIHSRDKTDRLLFSRFSTRRFASLDTLCPNRPLLRLPPSPRFLFILLGALAGLTPLAVDMYLPAIPAIARDLATSIDGAQLTISAFLGGFAIGQLFYGPLADSYGRKPVILAGLVMFAIASVGCAMADSLPELLVYRMLQAAGGAAGSVVVNALLRNLFEKDAFSRAMSFVILVMTLAPLVAPVVGGYISAHADWRVIFWLLVGISLLICLVMQWKIQETLKPEHRQPLNLGQILKNYWGCSPIAAPWVMCCAAPSPAPACSPS